MSLSEEEIAHARDLFAGLGAISVRKMFGGAGFYHRDTIFAVMLSDGRLMLKGKGAFIEVLEAEGCTHWTYTRDHGPSGSMPYWSLPDAAQDDPELASDWARRALEHL
ncbi:TfoX-like protein [Pseudomonas aeruginosa]|nr:TfoX-like protein [Pseudomonas aeruginosa]|tara:strand:+ start:780 stop:1103 length:324 start_codon:yes stop_codon:yes gene_type:complete